MVNYPGINLQQNQSESDPFTKDRYKQFFRYFPKGTKMVLDVGCNTGRGGKILKEANPELFIVGLDCVKERLCRLAPDVYERSICGYSTKIEEEASSYDVVLAGEFIEHLQPSDVEPTLKEFYRVLKTPGRLLLTTPNPKYIRLKLRRGSVIGGAHLSEHNPEDLLIKLQRIGFSNIRLRGSGRVSRFLGENFPIFSCYGSYLVITDKR